MDEFHDMLYFFGTKNKIAFWVYAICFCISKYLNLNILVLHGSQNVSRWIQLVPLFISRVCIKKTSCQWFPCRISQPTTLYQIYVNNNMIPHTKLLLVIVLSFPVTKIALMLQSSKPGGKMSQLQLHAVVLLACTHKGL